MKRIKMLGLVSSQYGSFSTGDVLRCSDEFARHLVEELGRAQYQPQPSETNLLPAAGPAATNRAAQRRAK